MTPDIVERVKAEEAELLRKLAAVRAFLDVYAAGAGKAAGATTPRAAKPSRPAGERATPARERVEISRFSPYGASVVIAAKRAISRAFVQPVPTRKLAEMIEADGLEIRGEDKVNALSALLSRSIDVQSNGRRGWTLAQEASDSDQATAQEDQSSGPGGVDDDTDNSTPFDDFGPAPSAGFPDDLDDDVPF